MDYLYPYCIECGVEQVTKWINSNYEKFLKIRSKYDSKDSAKKKKREFSKERRLNGRYKEWVLENRDKIKIYSERRSSKNHDISDFEWNSCKEYFNNQCAYCGLAHEDHFIFRKGKRIKSDFHREHVDDQGANDLSNCIPSCYSCNSQKWSFSISEWYNNENKNYTDDRLEKINNWIDGDYKNYTES